MKQHILSFIPAIFISLFSFSQPTHVLTDPELKFKEAKELFVKQQYALAYPMLQELKQQTPENQKSNNTYLNDDVNYYFIVSRLKL